MRNQAESLRRQALVVALMLAIGMSGCTRTVTHRIARFEPAGAATETTLHVPEAALWRVKVRGHGEKEYHGIDGTERWLQPGDVVGFRTGEDGVVYAVVNNEQMPLALTAEHRRVIWQARTQQDSELAGALGEAVTVTAQGAFLVGVGALLLWAAAEQDECRHGRDRDRCRSCKSHRH